MKGRDLLGRPAHRWEDKWTLDNYGAWLWTELKRFRVGSKGGLWRKRRKTYGLSKMQKLPDQRNNCP
jgi:hypothetical protein